MIGRHNLRMEEFIVSADAYDIVAPYVFRRASGRTGIEQRLTVAAGCKEGPSLTDSVAADSGRLVSIAIGVVTFNPCNKLGRVHAVAPVVPVVGRPALGIEDVADYVTIAAGSKVHQGAVFIFLDISVLKHLTIDEQSVLRDCQFQALDILVSESNLPEIIFL